MSNKDFELDFSTILASTVHDMKNSLGMLLGTVDQLISQCDPSTCPSTNGLFQLQYEGKRVNNNLIQLLALYRINNSQYFANISENDVNEFLEENLLEHQQLLSFKNITMEISCPEDLVWFFDGDLIAGVINNIINNAQKYCRGKLNMRAEVINGFLALHIEDNGSGYPEHMLHSDANQSRRLNFVEGSTGLGLYFASVVAGLHVNKNRKGYTTTGNDGIDNGGRFTIYIP